ncbi:MAG TPA: redoxin family protein [Bdellovibrionota bacterium]|nr:redoxin family protein [Bdellovibrionota bacterium]
MGTPLLGGLYAYQFTAQDSESQKVVPFKTFKAPLTKVKSAPAPLGESVEFHPQAPVTLVNFWATWCPPCVEEFPAMVELQRQLKDQGFRVVFISIDDDWAKVEKFLAENVIEIPAEQLFWDPTHEAAAAWGSEKFPESYVVRADGWVVEKIIGQQAWTRPSVVEYFQGLGQRYARSTHPVRDAVASVMSFDWLVNSAHAQAGTVINEKDRRTLETLRKNVETADKNLRGAEAALKTEQRSVTEQESIVKRRAEDVSEANEELSNFEKKLSELRTLKQKYETSLRVENQEKSNVENQIKSSRDELVSLEKQVVNLKDKLAQLQKTLNTRREGVETSQEALTSANSELDSFERKRDGANKVVDNQKREQKKAQDLLRERESSVSKLKSKVAELEKSLSDQKKKLVEAEKIINE